MSEQPGDAATEGRPPPEHGDQESAPNEPKPDLDDDPER